MPTTVRRHAARLLPLLIGLAVLALAPLTADATPRPEAAVARTPVVACAPLPGAHTAMLDGAYAPSAASLARLHAAGYRLYGGYLQSADAYHPWSRGDFARVRAAGFAVIPIFVGPGSGSSHDLGVVDGAATVLAARAAGFSAGPVVLDVEPAALRADPAGVAGYTAGWAQALRAAGYSPWGYGLTGYFRALSVAGYASSIDVAWIARYPSPAPERPDPHSVTGMPQAWTAAGTRMWQYQGSTDLDGATVDFSVADSGVGRHLRPGDC